MLLAWHFPNLQSQQIALKSNPNVCEAQTQLNFSHYLSVKGENQLTENQSRLQQPTAMEEKVQTKNNYI